MKPDTYTQLHYHVIFAVKYRHGLLAPDWRQDLFGYMAAIITHHGHTPLLVNGVEDHVHLAFGMRPTQALSDVVKDIKQGATRWLNDSGRPLGRFAWQEGYGAFTHSRSQLPDLLRYIENQEAHHQRQTFAIEYVRMLDGYGIAYDARYLFHPPT